MPASKAAPGTQKAKVVKKTVAKPAASAKQKANASWSKAVSTFKTQRAAGQTGKHTTLTSAIKASKAAKASGNKGEYAKSQNIINKSYGVKKRHAVPAAAPKKEAPKVVTAPKKEAPKVVPAADKKQLTTVESKKTTTKGDTTTTVDKQVTQGTLTGSKAVAFQNIMKKRRNDLNAKKNIPGLKGKIQRFLPGGKSGQRDTTGQEKIQIIKDTQTAISKL